MNLLALDIGGTSIKYGIHDRHAFLRQGKIPLPESWEAMIAAIHQILAETTEPIAGLAISAPGVVDQTTGVIGGVTAVPYIHQRNFIAELEAAFDLPVTMENDANCAALSEIWQGNAADAQNILYFVFGTGVGGAVIMNRAVHHGNSLFGGEFGYMFLNESQTMSETASIVQATKFYRQRMGQTISGEELFDFAADGDRLAQQLLEELYKYAARGIFNLAISFDPEKIILGGAISKNPAFLVGIQTALEKLVVRSGALELKLNVEPSKYGNDANLLGAVYNFLVQTEQL